jgi:transposase InsO family protein
MKQINLLKKFYHISGIDESEYSRIVFERKEKLEKVERLLSEGCRLDIALQVLNISRATYYRWKKSYKELGLRGLENEDKRPKKIRKSTWSLKTENEIYNLRKKYPVWGKGKIAIMYKKELGKDISQSTVGRILKKLIDLNKIKKVSYICGKKETKKRAFNGHAKRWKYGMKATIPGEMIQIDHMSVESLNYIKHFSAICPITKLITSKCYKTATSNNAADFLNQVVNFFPFRIKSIQVDGGSEFMSDFEKECEKRNIELFVLPPKSPEYNCHIERSNGTFKYEFYYQYSGPYKLELIQNSLQNFVMFYNKTRPHQGLGYLTPMEYYESIIAEVPKVSYVLN